MVVPYGSTVSNGSLLVVYIKSGNGTNPTQVADTFGNGPSGLFKLAIAGTGSFTFAVYYAWGVTGGADSVSVTWASPDNFGLIAISEYSGIQTTSDPYDGSASHFSSSNDNPIASGTLATSTAGDLLCGFFFDSGQGVGNSDNGFTIRQSIQFGQDSVKDDYPLAGPGNYQAISATGAGSVENAVGVAFLPAPPIPPGTVRAGAYHYSMVGAAWYGRQMAAAGSGWFADSAMVPPTLPFALDDVGVPLVTLAGLATPVQVADDELPSLVALDDAAVAMWASSAALGAMPLAQADELVVTALEEGTSPITPPGTGMGATGSPSDDDLPVPGLPSDESSIPLAPLAGTSIFSPPADDEIPTPGVAADDAAVTLGVTAGLGAPTTPADDDLPLQAVLDDASALVPMLSLPGALAPYLDVAELVPPGLASDEVSTVLGVTAWGFSQPSPADDDLPPTVALDDPTILVAAALYATSAQAFVQGEESVVSGLDESSAFPQQQGPAWVQAQPPQQADDELPSTFAPEDVGSVLATSPQGALSALGVAGDELPTPGLPDEDGTVVLQALGWISVAILVGEGDFAFAVVLDEGGVFAPLPQRASELFAGVTHDEVAIAGVPSDEGGPVLLVQASVPAPLVLVAEDFVGVSVFEEGDVIVGPAQSPHEPPSHASVEEAIVGALEDASASQPQASSTVAHGAPLACWDEVTSALLDEGATVLSFDGGAARAAGVPVPQEEVFAPSFAMEDGLVLVPASRSLGVPWAFFQFEEFPSAVVPPPVFVPGAGVTSVPIVTLRPSSAAYVVLKPSAGPFQQGGSTSAPKESIAPTSAPRNTPPRRRGGG